jgi:ATP-dependent DNA ligase
MPDETVLDGAVVALDSGKLSFNALQNYGSSKTPLLYCVFDVLILAGMMAKDVEKGIEGQVTESSVTLDA